MKPARILLVDDNTADQMLTARALRSDDPVPEIVVASNGVEAVDYLFGTGSHQGRDVAEQPSLILLDLKMPKLDGIEVLQRLRADERTRLVPVVVLTSSAEEHDRVTAYRCGCNSYIRKQVDFELFSEALQQVKRYWLVLNEGPPTVSGSARG